GKTQNTQPSSATQPVAATQPKPQTPVPAAAAPKIPGTFKSDIAFSMVKPQHTDSAATPATAGNGGNDSNSKKGNPEYAYGLKLGYETGFNHSAANKTVFSGFVEKRLNSRFSLMVQPAVKSSFLGNQTLAGSQSFYRAGEGKVTAEDSFKICITIPTN